MNCDRIRDLTSGAIDEGLTQDETKTYFGHLDACPPCRAFHEEMRQSLALLAELPVVEAREGFEDRVWQRLSEEKWMATRGEGRGLGSRLREFGEHLQRRWGRWAMAGVTASIASLVLVSSEPLPNAFVQGESPSTNTAGATTEVASRGAVPAADGFPSSAQRLEASEVEVIAEMPEAVREYLKNSKDLRLSGGDERFRKSNYSYPLRQVADPSLFHLTGEGVAPPGVSAGEGVPEAPVVISF